MFFFCSMEMALVCESERQSGACVFGCLLKFSRPSGTFDILFFFINGWAQSWACKSAYHTKNFTREVAETFGLDPAKCRLESRTKVLEVSWTWCVLPCRNVSLEHCRSSCWVFQFHSNLLMFPRSFFFFVFSATWRDYVYTLWYCTQTVPDKRRKLDRMETSNYSRCREGKNKRAPSQDGNQDWGERERAERNFGKRRKQGRGAQVWIRGARCPSMVLCASHTHEGLPET